MLTAVTDYMVSQDSLDNKSDDFAFDTDRIAEQLEVMLEVNPHDFDSDVDYYAALRAKPKVRSSMSRARGGDVDAYGNDWDEEEAFRANQRRYAAAKKAQQAADHDRIASGTNEGEGFGDMWKQNTKKKKRLRSLFH